MKISVIVPIYNIENYVEKCITSIIEQEFSDIEIILVDDGSTDGSSLICDKFAEKDCRIKVIHKKNGGLVSARKAGVNIATGEYILNVDGDDWIEKDRIQGLVDQISIFPADMIYMSGYKQDMDGQSVLIDSPIMPQTYYDQDIINKVLPMIQNPDKCFESTVRDILWMWGIKRKLLKVSQNLVDDQISMGEDRICIWFCLLKAKSVTLIQNAGYHYVHRITSLTYLKTNEERKRMKIWHNQLKTYIQEINNSDDIMRIFVNLNIMILLFSDYEMLQLENINYLFPYTKVVKNSKIVIYGAGRFGYSLVHALKKTNDYHIVSWVDQNEKKSTFLGSTIESIQNILQTEYDFIVIAVIYEKMALEIRQILMNMGVEEKKIALMDPRVVNEEFLISVFQL